MEQAGEPTESSPPHARLARIASQALQKALVSKCDFEVPETLIDQACKERFAAMLADMREKGATDEDLKEMGTVCVSVCSVVVRDHSCAKSRARL